MAINEKAFPASPQAILSATPDMQYAGGLTIVNFGYGNLASGADKHSEYSVTPIRLVRGQ